MRNATRRIRHKSGRQRSARGAAPLSEHSGQTEARSRVPSSGLLAVSVALLAASAPSSTAFDQTTTEPAPERTRSAQARPADAAGSTPPTATPSDGAATITVRRASDRLGNTVPAGLTAGVPVTVLDAYQAAHRRTNVVQPNCRVPLALLAAIGKVESGHARGGRVDAAGTTLQPILGPVLNGGPFAAIRDTDGGALDGDRTWDRAVGPMQFIPSTWERWAADGNDDGRADPHNVYDASLASARYLCAANRDLGTPAGLDAAILSYNHSTSYLNLVRSWMAAYRDGSIPMPDRAGVAPPSYDPDSVRPAVVTDHQPNQPSPSSAPPTSPTPSEPVRPAPSPTAPEPSPTPDQKPSPKPDHEPQSCAEQGLVDTAVGLVTGLLGSKQEQRDGCASPAAAG